MSWSRSFAVLIVGILPAYLCAQQPGFVPANSISLKIYTEHKSYRIGEPIVFRYRVRNIGHDSFLVPRSVWDTNCGNPRHIWAGLAGSSGERFSPGWGGSCGSSMFIDKQGATERMQTDAVLLKPTEEIEGSFTLEMSGFAKELRPGIYRLEVVFSGWKEDRLTDQQRSDMATMTSHYFRGDLTTSQNVELTH